MKSSDESPLSPNPWAGQPDSPRGPAHAGARVRVRAARQDVFVIYRPLHACPFCERRLFSGTDADGNRVEPPGFLPDPGDSEYLCPHVRRTEYQEILDRSVAATVEILGHTPTTLGNGTVQVLVSWIEVDGPQKIAQTGPTGRREF